MRVDPFWFGVLMTIVVEISLIIILGILRVIRGDDEDEEEMSDEEISEMLTEMTDNKYKFHVKDGILTAAKREGEDDAENN